MVEAGTAVATSLDGRRFTFESPIEGLELEVGGYASLDDRIGQVHSLEHARGSLARGDGVLLQPGAGAFDRVAVERAVPVAIERWLDSVRPRRAALDVGELLVEPSLRYLLDAGGFDRHTFFCGQSGSGKTFALGTVLEQLLLRTSLRIVVLDPNSDFVRLTEVRGETDPELAERYRSAVEGLVVRRSGEGATGSMFGSPTAMPRSRRQSCSSTPFATARSTGPSSTSWKAGSRAPRRALTLWASSSALPKTRSSGRSATGSATSASIAGRSGRRGTRTPFRISSRAAARASWWSTSDRSTPGVRRQSPPRASWPPSGAAAPTASRRWS
jgi:hypothetical protein